MKDRTLREILAEKEGRRERERENPRKGYEEKVGSFWICVKEVVSDEES